MKAFNYKPLKDAYITDSIRSFGRTFRLKLLLFYDEGVGELKLAWKFSG